MEINVTDYTTKKEEDNNGNIVTVYDFSKCDLEQAVRDQITLPNEAYNELHHAVFLTEDYAARNSMDDLEGWNEDNFTVKILE